MGKNCELDLSWASGTGFKGGQKSYFNFSIKAEADDHNFELEFNIDESRLIKEQLDKFLEHVDDGKHRWEPGNYFKNLK